MKDVPVVTCITWNGQTFWLVVLIVLVTICAVWLIVNQKEDDGSTNISDHDTIYDWSQEEKRDDYKWRQVQATRIANEIVQNCISHEHAVDSVCTPCFEACTIAQQYPQRFL